MLGTTPLGLWKFPFQRVEKIGSKISRRFRIEPCDIAKSQFYPFQKAITSPPATIDALRQKGAV
jgi:hypothetical protein